MHVVGDWDAWFEEGVGDTFRSQGFRGVCVHGYGVRGWDVNPFNAFEVRRYGEGGG